MRSRHLGVVRRVSLISDIGSPTCSCPPTHTNRSFQCWYWVGVAAAGGCNRGLRRCRFTRSHAPDLLSLASSSTPTTQHHPHTHRPFENEPSFPPRRPISQSSTPGWATSIAQGPECPDIIRYSILLDTRYHSVIGWMRLAAIGADLRLGDGPGLAAYST